MPEALITIAIIAVLVTVLLVVLGAAQSAQRTLDVRADAQSVLEQEVAAVQATDFFDVLQAPDGLTGAPALCTLGASGSRTSGQAIAPTAQVTRNGVDFTITRAVRWASTQDPATCANTPNDRGDTKETTITVSWTLREDTYTRSATVVSSRSSDPLVGPQIVVTR